MNYFFVIIGSYLLGSIPSSYLLGKLFCNIDLRREGSGNVGATNALRVLGWKVGLATLLFDILKGLAAVLITRHFFAEDNFIAIVSALAAVLGHIFTIFLSFKGGKGVATSAGVCLALIPVSFAFALLAFILVTALSKFVSLGSLTASLVLVGSQLVVTHRAGWQNIELLAVSIILMLFIVIKHQKNISRLLQGTENKISLHRKSTKG